MLVAAIGAVIVPLRLARSGNGQLSLAILVLIPVVATGFYAGLGTPDAATRVIDHQYRAQAQNDRPSDNQSRKAVGSVASMLDGLKGRLESNPNDAGGWLLLAKSYQHLDQVEDANAAYERARALGRSDAGFEKSIGSAASTETTPALDAGPALRGRLSVSADAAAMIQPGDVVFIFAKESPDQRMPVVAVRKPAADLPIDFILTDRDVLVAGTSLASFEELIVNAKISRSGLANETLEDLESWSDPISPLNDKAIELQINVEPAANTTPIGGNNE